MSVPFATRKILMSKESSETIGQQDDRLKAAQAEKGTAKAPEESRKEVEKLIATAGEREATGR